MRLLEVRDLRVSFSTPARSLQAVDGVSFGVDRGEVLAIVGESGSGKSVCAMSLVGLMRASHATVHGSALLEGRELIGLEEERLRRVRGAQIAMVFQDPLSSLNPVMRVGQQIAEQIRAHRPAVSRTEALERAGALMERVRIPAARARLRSYPHELSGGMRQRVMIAMALSCGPQLLLADEPTTALDVTVQAQILSELAQLREQEQLGIVLITHDFAVVAQLADRIAVMQSGRIVEHGPADRLLRAPRHPYTRGLLQALVAPTRARRPDRPPAAPLLELEQVHVSFLARHALANGVGGPGADLVEPSEGVRGYLRNGATARARVRARGSHARIHARHARTHALRGVSLTLDEGETLAIVGESGSGKTTLIRAAARLIEPTAGTIRFAGQDITTARGRRLARLRGGIGMVFQDPQASLQPRRRVGRTLEQALRAGGVSRADAPRQAVGLLEQVGLSAAHASRFPHELSGGERQRVAIARTVAARPRLVLLDEPVSSLDASLRRGVIELLGRLQERLGCSYVLVSHDLAVVAGVADRIAVMHAGEIVELGAAEQVLQRPQHPYTRELLAASPALPGDGPKPRVAR